jgi:TRAP transporter TAXI family solute receptor
MRFKAIHLAAAALITAVGLGGTVSAGEVKLPENMTWTAYGTTSSGYAQSVAIGNMLKNRHGTTLAVKPGKNDISRMTPLKAGKAGYCACGIASYFGSEGVALFANPAWGPQPIRVLMTSIGASGLGVGGAKDADIVVPADLKGKRVSWVRGGDALNVGVTAYLAFGGRRRGRLEAPARSRALLPEAHSHGGFRNLQGETVGGLDLLLPHPGDQRVAERRRGLFAGQGDGRGL